MDYIDLKRPLQVKTGDYRQAWMDAKVVSITLEDIAETEDGVPIKGLSLSIEFIDDGCCQHLHDVFGFSSDNWRYTPTENSCQECAHLERDGGDSVPYGSTTANLPECEYCVCPDVSEDDIDAYCEATNFGATCQHFKKK